MIRDLDALERSRLRSATCPSCGAQDLREGPSGGLATNWICRPCGAVYNVAWSALIPGDGFLLAEMVRPPDDSRRALAEPAR